MILPTKHNKGFTLIEVLMVMILVGILSAVSVDLIQNNLDETRYQTTVARMRQIQVAMVGDPTILENNSRTSFGYLGDIGSIPTAAIGIPGLVSNPTPSLPTYAVSSSARIGIGWNGPYITGASADYLNDGWGTAFVYAPTANPPTLTSLGSDRAVGGTGFAKDIVITLGPEVRTATVSGFICNRGAPFTTAAEVELNYPNGAGVLTPNPASLFTVTPAMNGAFSFSSIPFGVRSISVYQPSKATPTATIGPIVLTIDKPNYMVPCNAIDTNP
jgi:prepilin-type N-terminal cleavage/methylation domain-containing protein